MPTRIKQMVDAICEGDDNPLLREQAVGIAEAELWLSYIGREKLAVLERLRDPEEYSLAGHKGRQRWARIKNKVKVLNRIFDAASEQLVEVQALVYASTRAGRDPELEPLPAHLQDAWPPAFVKRRGGPPKERDEYQVLREGIRDLERLYRYEKRAWSQRKRALRGFMAVKLTSR